MDKLNIFLSSTQIDLQDERDKVQAVIEGLGHTCLRAELLDAPGTSPEDACRNMAQLCDVYIGIFGQRYGFVPPHLGISVSELEYSVACAHNPQKILIYIKDAPDPDIEETQQLFLKQVQDFATGYFRHEKFSSLDQLADQVKRDVVTWTTSQIRRAVAKQIELTALKDKIAHMTRVMEIYGVPEELR